MQRATQQNSPHVHAPGAIACAFIDVDAELSYWRQCHALGHLGPHGFDAYAALLRLGYDIYLGHPRAREALLYEVLHDAYQRHSDSAPLSWDETRWLVRRAWQRISYSS